MSAKKRRSPRESRSHGFEPLPAWSGLGTRSVHGARRPERNVGAVVPPIYQTTTFHYPAEFSEAAREDVHLYTRDSNPTQEVAAELVRGLEGGDEARIFASGMGAISTTLLTLLGPGDEVVALDTLYGGTLELLSGLLSRYGVRVHWISQAASRDPERALSGTHPRVVYLESPTNPLLNVHDLRRWAEAAHRAGALCVVDNTFATPINQRPLALGVDVVLHSGTKYLGGHADLMAGAVVGSSELIPRLDGTRRVLGPILDPFAAFLLTRGLRTLPLRVARQNETGRAASELFARHPAVERVHYPGRASAEEESIAGRQMSGRGGMVSVSLRGGRTAANRFLRSLRFVHVASSLGGVESLASVPAITSHRHLVESERRDRGIPEGLIRLSFGVEETDDLLRDVSEALDDL